MKRHFFIFSLSALTLFSCGGSQKQNQNSTTENTETTKSTEIKDTVKTVEKVATENTAALVAKLLDNEHTFTFEGNGGKCKYKGEVESENCETVFYCYPQKNGGYKVYVCKISFYDEMGKEYHEFNFFAKTFSDGKLSDSQVEPEIIEFIKNDGGLGGYDVFKFNESGVLIDIWDACPGHDGEKREFKWNGEKFVQQ